MRRNANMRSPYAFVLIVQELLQTSVVGAILCEFVRWLRCKMCVLTHVLESINFNVGHDRSESRVQEAPRVRDPQLPKKINPTKPRASYGLPTGEVSRSFMIVC